AGDAAYDQARRVHNTSIDRFPAIVVRAQGAEDVARAIAFARDHGLPLAVRGGGHSFAGQSSNDGGVVIDLSQMRKVVVDPVARTARVGAGITSAELAGVAHEHGLAISTGDTGSVGL